MATQIITQDTLIANLPPTLRQAAEAAAALQPQVDGRYEAAVQLVATGGARLNPDGSVDVVSRSGGARHHINGASCDCQDARFNAPLVAGRRACAHQVAAWILLKAARLAAVTPGPSPVNPVNPVNPVTHLTMANLLDAASRIAGGVAYEVVVTHIGGHGDANLLQAAADPQAHPVYLVCGSWHDDELFVAHWGRRWGQPDVEAMQQLAAALARPARTTLPAQASRTEVAALAPAMAYYLETTSNGVKVMVTHGEFNPRPVKTFSGPYRVEQAREFAATRAAAQVEGLRQATPGTRAGLRNDLLPEAWRQRMGGSQVGKAWVVYTERIADQRLAA